MISEREKRIRRTLRDDLINYAKRCLKIRTKTGKIKPFLFNKAQEYIHSRLEQQLAETGFVRAIILKGRQQGCSTYVQGRFYHKTTHQKGKRAFILTHDGAATDNLFDLTNRYHENCPVLVKPSTGKSNSKELIFDKLDSGYKVGTAGSKGAGRSSTIQYFHGSEVAFWDNADTHAAGVLQAIAESDETEIILESTANGMGNYFHRVWQQAESGQGDYQPIFVPWFWQTEYQKPLKKGFSLSEEEREYKELYGVSDEQIMWVRSKLATFKGDWSLFNQEYPATAAIAFQMSGIDSLIKPDHVIKARKETIHDPYGALILGVDPARFGDDRTGFVWRKGRKVIKTASYEKKDNMEVVGLVQKAIAADNIAKIFIDVGGLGAGVVDRLNELGFGYLIIAVNAGESALDKNDYYNKRAEMWGLMRDWIKEAPVDIPDNDELQSDLCCPAYSYDSNGRLQIEKKENIKKRGLRSPDLGDALALTFALPVSTELGNTPQIDNNWIV